MDSKRGRRRMHACAVGGLEKEKKKTFAEADREGRKKIHPHGSSCKGSVSQQLQGKGREDGMDEQNECGRAKSPRDKIKVCFSQYRDSQDLPKRAASSLSKELSWIHRSGVADLGDL